VIVEADLGGTWRQLVSRFQIRHWQCQVVFGEQMQVLHRMCAEGRPVLEGSLKCVITLPLNALYRCVVDMHVKGVVQVSGVGYAESRQVQTYFFFDSNM